MIRALTSTATRSREAIVSLLVIAVATALVYSNTFDASFHFDDLPNIVRNPTLRDLSSLWPPSGNRYLGYLSFALNFRLGGLRVFGYHLVNVLIHACNGLLVFWLTAVTLRTPALRNAQASPLVRRYLPVTAGLLFAVHPVQTQAVTYIVQRFASLATLFYLLSIVLYAKTKLSLEADPVPRARVALLFGSSVLAAVAAMKTKEISFTLPFVAAGYELLFLRTRKRLGLLLLASLGATALLVPIGFATSANGFGDALVSTTGAQQISRWTYLLTQLRVIVTYLRLLLLPVGQNVDYEFALSHSLSEPSVAFALAALVSVGSAAVLLLLRAREANRTPGVLVFFGTAWFFATLSVESSIIPIRDVIFEHRMYLPSVGASVAFGTIVLVVLERLRSSISPVHQVTALLLVTAGPLGAATYARNLVWKDDVTLWSDAVTKSPQKARPHTSLGVAYQAKGQLEDAMRECRAALQLDPEAADTHICLGAWYEAKGQIDDAMREYREAIRLYPEYATAHYDLGNIHRAAGRTDDAVLEYREAIRLDPGMVEAHNNLGVGYAAKGRLYDAMHEFREAIRLDPAIPDAHGNLGSTLLEQGRAIEAVAEHRRALELNPIPESVFNLATSLEAVGREREAIAEYQRFLEQSGDRFPVQARVAVDRVAQLRAFLKASSRE